MKREVAWEWVQGAGLEHCAIVSSPRGVEMTGVVVADWEGRTLAVHYHLQCDAGWHLVRALVRAAHGGERSERTIEQASSQSWRIDGADAPELAGCEDIDLMATPLTNTLPVKRLQLAAGQPREFDVAWVRLPDLRVLRARQQYTRLDTDAGAARQVRYRSVDSGFTADLALDSDGLVIDYPPHWTRIGNRSRD